MFVMSFQSGMQALAVGLGLPFGIALFGLVVFGLARVVGACP